MNPTTPDPDPLDRVRDDLGDDAQNLSEDQLAQAIDAIAWSDTPIIRAPDSLKHRVFAALPEPELVKLPTQRSVRKSSRLDRLAIVLPWAAVLIMGVNLVILVTQSARWKDIAERQSIELAAFQENQQLDRLKIVSLKSQLDIACLGSAVWNAQAGRGLLNVSNLPPLEPGKDYQLWIVDPAYVTPVSGGVFQVDASGMATIEFTPDREVRQVDAFAVSLEKKGGVEKAEGPMVLAGAF